MRRFLFGLILAAAGGLVIGGCGDVAPVVDSSGCTPGMCPIAYPGDDCPDNVRAPAYCPGVAPAPVCTPGMCPVGYADDHCPDSVRAPASCKAAP